jgi:hypothetical protein
LSTQATAVWLNSSSKPTARGPRGSARPAAEPTLTAQPRSSHNPGWPLSGCPLDLGLACWSTRHTRPAWPKSGSAGPSTSRSSPPAEPSLPSATARTRCAARNNRRSLRPTSPRPVSLRTIDDPLSDPTLSGLGRLPVVANFQVVAEPLASDPPHQPLHWAPEPPQPLALPQRLSPRSRPIANGHSVHLWSAGRRGRASTGRASPTRPRGLDWPWPTRPRGAGSDLVAVEPCTTAGSLRHPSAQSLAAGPDARRFLLASQLASTWPQPSHRWQANLPRPRPSSAAQHGTPSHPNERPRAAAPPTSRLPQLGLKGAPDGKDVTGGMTNWLILWRRPFCAAFSTS